MTIIFCILAAAAFGLGIATGPNHTGDQAACWLTGLAMIGLAWGFA